MSGLIFFCKKAISSIDILEHITFTSYIIFYRQTDLDFPSRNLVATSCILAVICLRPRPSPSIEFSEISTIIKNVIS